MLKIIWSFFFLSAFVGALWQSLGAVSYTHLTLPTIGAV